MPPKHNSSSSGTQQSIGSFFGKPDGRTEAKKPKLPNFDPSRPAKLYCWNINGIKSVLEKFDMQKFLKKHDPDVLAIQEIKTIDSKIDGYKAQIPPCYA